MARKIFSDASQPSTQWQVRFKKYHHGAFAYFNPLA